MAIVYRQLEDAHSIAICAICQANLSRKKNRVMHGLRFTGAGAGMRWQSELCEVERNCSELVALLASLLGERVRLGGELEILIEVVKLGAIVLELHMDVGEQ